MSNKLKRAAMRRKGVPVPPRSRNIRHGSEEPSKHVFEAIALRLKSKECPICGERIHERADHFKRKQLEMPICINGHRQDVWEEQRPEAVAKRKAEAEKAAK